MGSGKGALSCDGCCSSHALILAQVALSWKRSRGLATCVNKTACLATDKDDFFDFERSCISLINLSRITSVWLRGSSRNWFVESPCEAKNSRSTEKAPNNRCLYGRLYLAKRKLMEFQFSAMAGCKVTKFCNDKKLKSTGHICMLVIETFFHNIDDTVNTVLLDKHRQVRTFSSNH